MDKSSKQDMSEPQPVGSNLRNLFSGSGGRLVEADTLLANKAASGTEVEERAGYSKYMSYPSRDKGGIAIPTWEVTSDHLAKLDEQFIIPKQFTPDEMKQKIRSIMHPIVDLVLAGEEFSFRFPNNSLLSYDNEFCFPLVKRGKWVTRSFYNKNSTHTSAMTAWLLMTIYYNINCGYVVTQRDLLYRCPVLFREQRYSNGIITDICLMFECTRRSLNISSEEKGLVCGSLRIILKDGGILDCSRRTHIPDVTEIDYFEFGTGVAYIIVVEKGTIFNYLVRLKFHLRQGCIIMTSNGMPNINARMFLKKLQKEANVPVIGLADPDPSGLMIMTCYSQGSAQLAHENFNLAVPSLMWVGVSLLDIEESGIQLHEYNSSEFTKKDLETLNSLLSENYVKLTPRWRAAL